MDLRTDRLTDPNLKTLAKVLTQERSTWSHPTGNFLENLLCPFGSFRDLFAHPNQTKILESKSLKKNSYILRTFSLVALDKGEI